MVKQQPTESNAEPGKALVRAPRGAASRALQVTQGALQGTAVDDASPAVAAPRQKNRERTLADLQQALKTLQANGQKVTLKSVAELAGVSPSLLNHRYPDFAEQVRALVGRTIREQRNDMADQLANEREKNRQLRRLIEAQLGEITKVYSINEALRAELALQRGIAEGKVSKGVFGHKKPEGSPSKDR
ncbi:MAG: TetR/AcrR family transcriptional regulator [Betaproteobacteria bacterium]|nr:TetR/AcrR family transcriptional regulator [Betaproteobacteria bacterium]